jgi:hypothetical protein
VFFVASVPPDPEAHVNVSPRGLDTFRVLDRNRVAWLDLTGRGVETIAHLKAGGDAGGRITLMFCAFEGPPQIIRLHGYGRVHEPDSGDYEKLRPRFPDLPGERAIIDVAVNRVASSCGFGIPRMELLGSHGQLLASARLKGPEKMAEYRAKERSEHRWPPRPRRVGDVVCLDRALPRWDRRERHRISCDAPSAAVMRTAEELTGREVPIFRGLMTMMSLGRPRLSPDEPVFGMFIGAGFEVICRSEDEIVVGGIERSSRSRPVVRLAHPDLADFRDFQEPGCIKIGANFRHAHGVLTTETRVHATDLGTRRLFIRSGSGLIRHVWLRAIRRRARIDNQHPGAA